MGCDETQEILLGSERKVDGGEKVSMSVEKIHTPSQVVKWGIEEDDGSVEVTSIDFNTHSDSEPNDLEDEQASVSSDLEDKSLDEEMDCSSPLANHESRMLLQSSSVVEISRSKDYSLSEPPRLRKGLDHSITAPVQRNLFVDSQGFPTSRSMIENRGYPRPDLKLDRISEQKKKSIVDWVKIQNDGTVEVDLTKDAPVASELLELRQVEEIPSSIDCIITDYKKSIPKLNIAMLVVGTRGDVQPFLAVASRLQEYGHHVRLATHSNFRKFVESHGIDFYPLGGDPRVLAASMARNKGLIPSSPKEIRTQRKQIKAIIETLLPACTEADPVTGDAFRAQAIIANPPAYGHTHVAEALGVPLHIFFTMPWTPTYAFPHPFARVPQSAGYWLSYILVDLLIWWGIRAYINDFRNKLKLPPMAYFSTYHGSIYDLPTGYMWSPCLVPKPNDWGPLVDVVGYCFLDLGSKDQPPEEIVQWIQKGNQPIYIGFGSMPLDDSNKIMDIILEALENTGQRGIIDRGWADLGTQRDIPDNVFLLKDCPHDWLFPQCAAVVHHGGAGTTAAGLKAGCPTTVVPFFGDQFFWGDRIYQRGLGPAPIPISQLSVDSLSEAIRFMLQPEIKYRATELGERIQKEDGVGAAVDAFHRHLPAELPLPPPPSSLEKHDTPNPLQWFFIKIGTFCSLPCGRS